MRSDPDRVSELEAELRAARSAAHVASIKDEVRSRHNAEDRRRIIELEAALRAAEKAAQARESERDEAREALLLARDRLSKTAQHALEEAPGRSRVIGELRHDVIKRAANLAALERQAAGLVDLLAEDTSTPAPSSQQLLAVRDCLAARMATLDKAARHIEALAGSVRAASAPADDTSRL